MGYSLQANRKTLEGARHPDRDAQFEHINATVAAALAARQPVISVDAKKRRPARLGAPRSAASQRPLGRSTRSPRAGASHSQTML
jgi:hypothetical protein